MKYMNEMTGRWIEMTFHYVLILYLCEKNIHIFTFHYKMNNYEQKLLYSQ